MEYQHKETKLDLALKALEILKSEGIDVSQIAPRRKFNGERRDIYLKEVRDERILEIIEKYNLDPNLQLGIQIQTMRSKIHLLDEATRIRKKMKLKKY